LGEENYTAEAGQMCVTDLNTAQRYLRIIIELGSLKKVLTFALE